MGHLMGHGLRNIIVIVCIGLIASAIGVGLFLYLSLDLIDASLAGLAGFGVLLVIHNNITLQRHFRRAERHFRSVHQFEENIAGRLQSLETANVTSVEQATDNDQSDDGGHLGETTRQTAAPGLLMELSSNARKRGNHPDKPANANITHDNITHDNIIALNSKMERIDTTQRASPRTFKIKPSQLTKALDKGGSELYLQPVVELPSQNIRYFEAFVRLRIGDNILTAKQFLPAAKDAGQIAAIDLLSLGLTFKVVRGLQRQDNSYPVFWNIAPQTLGNKGVFKELLEQLRANQPLNQQLICEISHSAFIKLNRVQSDNLARIRDLGFELSLDKVNSGQSGQQGIESIIESGMFAIIKIPASELMRIDKNDIVNFAHHIVPVAEKSNVTIIASDIESDAQSVAMIDADVLLAQGDGLIPAKALKKELGSN